MYKLHFKYKKATLVAITVLATANAVSAQTVKSDSIKSISLKGVTIFGKQLKGSEYTKINKEEINLIQAPTIGETLSRIPGIQSSYFGPNSGAAVIRGLSGNRVKMLNNGISMNDLSGISPDFNINLNFDNIDSIKVYKSSASVLFGGKAIGGAINIENQLVPAKMPDKAININAGIEGSTNNGSKQFFNVEGTAGQHMTWNIGAKNYKVDNIHIPGNSKPDIVYDPKTIGFDTNLQLMSQVNVESEHVLNTTIFPYMSQFALDHLKDPEYELSPDDVWTFSDKYYDSASGTYKDNPKNPNYVPGQDPVKDRYKDVVKSIKDYGPTKKKRITNSHAQSNSINAGWAYIDNKWNVGVGYECNYAYYGIPAYGKIPDTSQSHTHENGETHTTTTNHPYMPINVMSNNNVLAIKGEGSDIVPLFSKIKIQMNGQLAADKELLGEGTISQFNTSRGSGRLELHQKKCKVLEGLTGADYNFTKITGKGNYRYLPDNQSQEVAVFTEQHVTLFHFLQASAGYRHDFIHRKAFKGNGYQPGRGLAGGDLRARRFDLDQFSAELKASLANIGYLHASFSHSQRAPEVNELYAGNNHYAIVVEENGDDKLNKEIANTVELGGHFAWNGFELSVDWFRTEFNNYIYLAQTGVERNGFLVKEWRAGDSRFYGIESQLSYKANFHSLGTWKIGAYYDWMKAKNTSDDQTRKWAEGDYLPNMPTSRFGFNLLGKIKRFTVYATLDHYLKMKYLAKNVNEDHAFPAYSLLNARVSYKVPIWKVNTEFYVYGSNLLNEEARPQNSMLRYLAPLPGINVGGGIKINI